VFAEEGAGDVGPEVAEFGDENEMKDVELPGVTNVRIKIDFLDEVEEPRDIHQTK